MTENLRRVAARGSRLKGRHDLPVDTGRCAQQAGFTLIELIIFIVISGILAVGLAATFSTTMRGAAGSSQLTQATQLAQERMELILARRRAAGFAAMNDPCNPGPGPALCTPPAGYTFTPLPTIAATVWGGDAVNYRLVTVTVVATAVAQTVTLTALVANY